MDGVGETEPRKDGLYLPLAQEAPGFVSVAVKTRGNPLNLAPLVRKEVTALDADLPIYFVSTMDDVLANETFFPKLFSVLFSIFGACALVLAAVGIYGVMAFSVERRTQEIGIRMALGSGQNGVLKLILTQGLRQLGLGLAVGLVPRLRNVPSPGERPLRGRARRPADLRRRGPGPLGRGDDGVFDPGAEGGAGGSAGGDPERVGGAGVGEGPPAHPSSTGGRQAAGRVTGGSLVV